MSRRVRFPRKDLLSIPILSILVISIFTFSYILSQKGVSFDIREKAAYPTPTPLPTLTPAPIKQSSLKATGCNMLSNSPPLTHCKGTVTWSTKNVASPILRIRVGRAWTIWSTLPSGSNSFNLTNTSDLQCTLFRLYDGTTLLKSARACINYYTGLFTPTPTP